MLSFASSEEKQSKGFHLLGTVRLSNNYVHLISNNTSLISANHSLLSSGCEDTCSFYSGPSDSTILSFGEQSESCGSIAFGGIESCGSIAYAGGSAFCGSIASSSCSSGFSGGCSYSC